MNRYVATMGLFLVSWAITAQSEVLSGRITRIDANHVDSTVVDPAYCGNKSHPGFHCTALVASNVIVKDASGAEHRISRLLLETETRAGLMNMMPSDSVIAFAMAFTPKDQWNDIGNFTESAEASELQYVYVDGGVAIGHLTITLKLHPALEESWAKISGDPSATAPGAIALEYGAGLDLQALGK